MLKFLKLTIFCLIFLTGCNYEPIFKNKKYDFAINIEETSGEKIVNNFIINKLKNFENKNKIYKLNLNTKKERIIISKDSRGDPSKLQIKVECDFTVFNDERILISMTVFKKIDYNNNSDKFELKNYENFVTQNLSNSIADEIISKISNLQN